MISDNGLSSGLLVSYRPSTAWPRTCALTDRRQRHVVLSGELQPEVTQVSISDVDRRRWPPGQADQQYPAVLIEAFEIPVTPVDDLRDEAVGAHVVAQCGSEVLPLIIGVQGTEAVERRLQVLVQFGVQLTLGRIWHPCPARPRPAPG